MNFDQCICLKFLAMYHCSYGRGWHFLDILGIIHCISLPTSLVHCIETLNFHPLITSQLSLVSSWIKFSFLHRQSLGRWFSLLWMPLFSLYLDNSPSSFISWDVFHYLYARVVYTQFSPPWCQYHFHTHS